MSGDGTQTAGLLAFEARDWGRSFTSYAEADAVSPLEPGELERWAMTAYLTGRDDVCVELLTRAHHDLLRADPVAADRLAFWIAFNLLNRGEAAQAGGWLSRARRLLDDPDVPECAVSGYLLMPTALGLLEAGDAAVAQSCFVEMTRIGERFEDPDLLAFGILGQGECQIAMGEPGKGVARLDEVMVAVMSSELSVVVTGLVYCAVIEACHEIYDVRRAREWTTALSAWCGAQPDLVPYRGQCLVHRAEILQLHGEWAQASREAEKARRLFSRPPGHPALGAAIYRMAELHRLRGDFPTAEHAYRQAGQCGHETQPGLALMRLDQGREEAARAGVDRALQEAGPRGARPHLLAASVTIALRVGDVPRARAAADALAGFQTGGDVPVILALSAHASSAVLLAEGDPVAALTLARRAWSTWHSLDIPYEAARARVLVARAARGIGDEDTARMELDAAHAAFAQLDAATDLAHVVALEGSTSHRTPGALTAREVQVLRLVAAGKTNRGIAADLCLSEKTVARHLANIFAKLGLSNRAAATAYAFRHNLA